MGQPNLSAAATTLLPPTLVGLGMIKGLELWMRPDASPEANPGPYAQTAQQECDGPLPV